MIRQQNYTVTARGRVLQLLSATLSDNTSEPHGNPLLLTRPERYVSLFCLLDADGDLLKGMYRRLLEAETFTRVDAGDAATATLQELVADRFKKVAAGPMQQVRTKLERTINAVQNQSKHGQGPRESIATPRTEPLVD